MRPDALERRFEAVVFDWDGTAVPDRAADASEARGLIEELCDAGMHVAVVSGTHVGNIDGQLRARPPTAGRLVLALNRGSEIYRVDARGPHLVARREATADEDAALTRAAQLTVARLRGLGLRAEIVSQRLNRRKIDLIPEPEWRDPPKARIDELLSAVIARLLDVGLSGLHEVVELAAAAARETGLGDPRVTSDAKHVEIGLTDKSDSARWLLADLWRSGIAPSQVLIGGDELGPLGGLPGSDSLMLVPEAARVAVVSVGVEPGGAPEGVVALGGGPASFLALLSDQLARRRAGEAPRVDDDPAWSIVVEGFDPEHERARAAMLVLADGRLGTSGTPVAAHAATVPWVLAAGVYDGDGPETALLPGPVWHRLPVEVEPGDGLRRVLDLHAGLLGEGLAGAAGTLRSARFSSLARPGTVALRAEGTLGDARAARPLLPPAGAADHEGGTLDDHHWMAVAASSGGGIVAAASEQRRSDGRGGEALERLAVFCVNSGANPGADAGAEPRSWPDAERARVALQGAEHAGYEQLLAEHRAAWAARWREADVVIEGDDDLQQAVRFALFHVMASVGDTDEAAVGARGLTGPAYRGHVFWDADTFVLPVLAATHPAAARAMLEYRVRRLPAARSAAHALGLDGARFPWESAGSGDDVTPPLARDRAGRVVPIRTGQLEEHIVAEIAWAACCYADWTGDAAFATGPGREILVETARYWTSRIRVEPDGSAHLLGVIGPDEYHGPVDDNAFTNVMARWNLRRAASAAAGTVENHERARWRALGDALVDGYDAETARYEEFAGFGALEPLVIEEVAPRRPIAADLLLGAERVRDAQVVKQADVLMLHHLVPDEVAPGSLEPNLRFYEQRTSHGSSLSPGIHAALFARARDFERALAALRLASRIDLDDLTDATAGGLHLGTCASVWHAMAFGFAGLRPGADVLRVDPCLPPDWSAFEVRVRFRGSRVRLRKERGALTVDADPPCAIALGTGAAGAGEHTVGSEGTRFRRHGTEWEVE